MAKSPKTHHSDLTSSDNEPGTEIFQVQLEPIAQAIRDRKLDVARGQLQAILDEDPTNGQAVFLMGLTFHRERRYSEANRFYEQAIVLSPRYAPIHHFRGWATYYLGELAASRASFAAFLALQPDEPDSHYALGLIELDEHNLDAAEQRFLTSIQLRTGRATDGKELDRRSVSKAYYRLGDVYEQRNAPGDIEKAKQHLKVSVDLYPDHYEAMYKLHRVLLRLGETEEAEAVHQQYLTTKARVEQARNGPADSADQ